MEVSANLKFIRVTPRKAMLVADLIRGKNVNDAMNILKVSKRKRTAGYFLKLLKSAVANADTGGRLDVDTLYVSQLQIGNGPILKRFMPRAKGSATRINKKTSHIMLKLSER